MIAIPMEDAAQEIRVRNAFEMGMENGLEKGKIEMAKNLIAAGIPAEVIAKSSGISLDEVLALADEK